MSDTYIGSSQLILINDKNANDLGMTDLFDDAPVIKALAATVASNGTQHKYLKETVAPTVGFRAVGSGLNNSNSTDVEITLNLKILAASFAIEKAVADGYYKGPAEFVAREMRRQLRAAFFWGESQLFNGTGAGDANGFAGFADSLTASSNQMVIKATGTTAATGSSVYAIRTNDLGRDCQFVLGNQGNVAVGETIVQRIDDGAGKHYPAYYTPVEGWCGLQLGSALSVGRLANLTADSGATLTDILITKLLSAFPASRQPNLLVMNRRSLAQLQASRTSYNPTGAPAEIPSQAFNIPIIVTDGIVNTEALIS
jgi:hypothetical protein